MTRDKMSDDTWGMMMKKTVKGNFHKRVVGRSGIK